MLTRQLHLISLAHGFLLTLCALVWVSACDSSPLGGSSKGGDVDSNEDIHAETGGGEADSDAGQESDGEDADGEDGDGDSQTDELELGACEPLLACARAVELLGLTELIAKFGTSGSCWTLDGAEAADCWRDCRAQLDLLSDDNPAQPECRECETNEDCDYDESLSACGLDGRCIDGSIDEAFTDFCRMDNECGGRAFDNPGECVVVTRMDYHGQDEDCKSPYVEFYACLGEQTCDEYEECFGTPSSVFCDCGDIYLIWLECAYQN